MIGYLLERIRSEFSFVERPLAALLISMMLTQLGWAMTYPYWSPFLEALGASPFMIGVLSSFFSTTLLISRIPGAYLTDVIGRKRLITIFTFGVALTQLLYVFAPDWRVVAIALVLEGFLLIYQPALSAITADLIPEEKRGIGFSLARMLPQIVSIISPLAAGYIVSMYGLVDGMRIIFFIIFVSVMVAGAIRHIYLVETLEDRAESIELSFSGIARESISSMIDAWRKSPKELKILILIMLVSSMEDPIFMNFLSLYVFDVAKLSKGEWGVIISLFFALTTILYIPAGKIVDKIGRRSSLLITYVLTIPAILVLISPYPPLSIWLAMTIVSLPNALLPIVYNAWITDLTPQEYRGRIFGLIANLNTLIVILTAPLGGYLYEVSPHLPFLYTVILSGLVVVLILTLLDSGRGDG